jgi:hypothetical protein
MSRRGLFYVYRPRSAIIQHALNAYVRWRTDGAADGSLASARGRQRLRGFTGLKSANPITAGRATLGDVRAMNSLAQVPVVAGPIGSDIEAKRSQGGS